MKKLVIAAFAMAFATATQAATVWWQNGLGSYNDPDTEYSGDVYLMTGGEAAASALVSAVIAAGDDYVSAYNTAIAAAISTMDYGNEYSAEASGLTAGETYDFFVVALDSANKGLFVSEVVSETILAVGDTDVFFDAPGSYESPFAAGVTTYDSTLGGWYTAGAVPEPTSGLMLLLGLAGLALKRRRA